MTMLQLFFKLNRMGVIYKCEYLRLASLSFSTIIIIYALLKRESKYINLFGQLIFAFQLSKLLTKMTQNTHNIDYYPYLTMSVKLLQYRSLNNINLLYIAYILQICSYLFLLFPILYVISQYSTVMKIKTIIMQILCIIYIVFNTNECNLIDINEILLFVILV